MHFIEFINDNKYILEKGGIETPFLDCKLILSHFFNIPLNRLFLENDTEINEVDLKLLNFIIQERLKGKPVSKIFGIKTFWTFDFFVNEDVLDPRPDTEIMIEAILKNYNIEDKLNILDLGTGSGCIILTLLKLFYNSKGLAIDISEKALNIAKKNAHNLQLEDVAEFKINNWNDGIDEKFDLIVSNPPYIPSKTIDYLSNTVKDFDPITALNGGEDGLQYYRYLSRNLLKSCGDNTQIFLEIGINQKEAVIELFEKQNFKLKKAINDYSGICRILHFALF